MTSSDPRVLEFFYFDAGGGHRSAATALRQVIADRLPHWRVEMVNLQELLQPVDPLFRWTKIQSQNLYNGVVKRGWKRASRPTRRRWREYCGSTGRTRGPISWYP